MKNFGLLFTDVKDFLSNELNRIFVAILMLCVLVGCGQYRTEKYLAGIKADILKNRDKIHFRYFNLTKSLEGIYKVAIDTKNGEIKK